MGSTFQQIIDDPNTSTSIRDRAMIRRVRSHWCPSTCCSILVTLYGPSGHPEYHRFGCHEETLMRHIHAQIFIEDIRSAEEVHVVFCPSEGVKPWSSTVRQNWFRRESHHLVPYAFYEPKGNLNTLYPLYGLCEKFEGTVRCLETLCCFMANHMKPLATTLTFDFIAFAPADAARLLDCLEMLPPLKHVAFGIGGLTNPRDAETKWEMPAGGRSIIQDLMFARAYRLTSGKEQLPHGRSSKAVSFAFFKLPQELQEMILAYVVTDESLVPISNPSLRIPLQFERLRAKRCCGRCRAFKVEDDHACRCTSSESYSTSCRCVSLSDGVFLASKEVRVEALRLYWTRNTFLAHGPMGGTLRGSRPTIQELICSVPIRYLNMIRHLTLDTDWHLQGFEKAFALSTGYLPQETQWCSVLHYLKQHGGRRLKVEIQSNRKLLKGSYAWRQRFANVTTPWTIDSMAEDIKTERERFRNDVAKLDLKIKVVEIFDNEQEVLILHH